VASLVLGLALLAGIILIPRLAHAASSSVTNCSTYGTATTAGTLAKAFADAAASVDTGGKFEKERAARRGLAVE
jgi:hypothetical protein